MEERGLVTPIEKQGNSKAGYLFDSIELSQLLNGYYEPPIPSIDVSQFLAGNYETPSRPSAPELITTKIFENAGRDEKLSFLAGAYARHGERNSFFFVNSDRKLKMIADLLREFGCRNVTQSVVQPGMLPLTNKITFEPSAEVERWFQYVMRSPTME